MSIIGISKFIDKIMYIYIYIQFKLDIENSTFSIFSF